jgi:FimV-like protein
VRNRILAVILVAGCVVSTLAHALGLGDIEVYSALNQPLVAEIELGSVRPGETDNMRVKLADEDAFLQAGVERPFYLTKLKFNLAVKPDGTQYISVTTQDPTREPFLNFLVDVDWPRGRLVREYTVLLDPPVFAGSGQAPATQGETAVAGTAASAAGTPALIQRDDTEVSDDDFVFEDLPADQVPAQAEQFADIEDGRQDEFGEASDVGFGDDGLGIAEKAETADLSAGLPDIEITAGDEADANVTAGSEVSDYQEYSADGDEFVFTDTDTTASDSPPVDSAEPAYDDSEEPYLDDGDQPAYLDEAPAEEPVFSASGIDTSLPDIDLFYDASLPYDEAATNALLAQFAAEDEARARREGVSAGSNEHLVESGDTLYEIASHYKAPDVSVDQAMLSILRYNPDAFIRDNINSVRKGFVLRVPDRESMLQINSAEAMAEVRQHHALWREYRDQLAGAPSTARDARSADELHISEQTATRDTDAGGELSILSPGRDAESSDRASGAQEGSESGSSLYVDLQLAREQLQAERLEKNELQARLTDLTGQIEKMDRLISLKDEQLAQLQQRLSELDDQTTALPADSDTTTKPITKDDSSVEAVTDEFRPGLTLQAEAEDPEPAVDTDIQATLDEEPDQTAQVDEQDAESARYGLDFGDEFEPVSGEEQSQGPQTGDQTPAVTDQGGEAIPDSEQATEADVAISAEQADAVLTERKRPEGLIAYIYDYLPPPYNIMAADFLEASVDVPVAGRVSIGILVLGGVGAFILLFIWLAIKPKKKKPVKAAPVIDIETHEDEEDVHLTVQPAKPSFGERVSLMFAPIAGMFGGSKKPSGIAAIAGQANHKAAKTRQRTEYPDEESDAIIEDLGEIESFDETAKTAAEQASSETGGRFTSTQKSAPAPAKGPVQEETSDDTTQEADVYLAYGLHDQAEELLTQALTTHPGKIEYQGKLLETYFASGKKNEFVALAKELHRKLAGRSSRIWDKAIAMGKEIAPDNSLFSDAAGTGLKVSDFAPARPETADLDLSESQGNLTPDIEFDEIDGPASTTTDFDLDLSEGEEELDDTFLIPPGGNDDRTQIMSRADVKKNDAQIERHDTDLQFDLEADADEMASDLNIDFNADELGLDTEIDVDTSMEMENGTQFEDDATVLMEMPFNLDDEGGSSKSDDGAIELDSDLSGEINIDDVFEADSSSAGDDLLADLDLGGSDDLRGASVNTEFEIPEDDDTLIDADLDDETISGDIGDEVSTKLDLAKAYMDMGDYDGASSTLEEVMAEGDAAQRKEAEELLEQIH